MPPTAGLQDICAIRSRFMVTMAVLRPIRAHARAASQPAWPAPTTTTSYFSCIRYDCISMRILVIGSGGREHALAWKLSQSPAVEKIYAAPGNPGMARCGECVAVAGSFLEVAESVRADLTVVGPEGPLVAGVADEFRAAGKLIVGPTKENAQLEGSKIFAKDFFRRYRIPTADFVSVDTLEDARKALSRFRYPVVIKADGLAAGKGVIIATDRAEAGRAVDALGPRLVIE